MEDRRLRSDVWPSAITMRGNIIIVKAYPGLVSSNTQHMLVFQYIRRCTLVRITGTFFLHYHAFADGSVPVDILSLSFGFHHGWDLRLTGT